MSPSSRPTIIRMTRPGVTSLIFSVPDVPAIAQHGHAVGEREHLLILWLM
ncbi:MAG: hypothetical protein U0521_26160 [Anaerolineae bacterium]